jgi:hypothetical protein
VEVFSSGLKITTREGSESLVSTTVSENAVGYRATRGNDAKKEGTATH